MQCNRSSTWLVPGTGAAASIPAKRGRCPGIPNQLLFALECYLDTASKFSPGLVCAAAAVVGVYSGHKAVLFVHRRFTDEVRSDGKGLCSTIAKN
jgi:hypothetical protein